MIIVKSFIVFIFLLAGLLAIAETPVLAVEKSVVLEGVPDYTQQNDNFPWKGSSYCAPVSASNYVVWLSQKGFPLLAQGITQETVVKQLAHCMKTGKDGTDPKEFAEGLAKYVMAKGYSVEYLDYQGWKPTTNKLTHTRYPQLTDIARALSNNDGVFANVGWYTYNKNGNFYERIGGHWVTVVGITAAGELLINDPASRAGWHPSTQTVSLTQIGSGLLKSAKGNNYKNLPTNAQGYYRITGGMFIHEKADLGIIDGIVLIGIKG